MSSSIDSKIATLKFDNTQFQAASAQTLSTLASLGKALSGFGAISAFSNLSKSAAQTDLTPVSTQIDGISSRFLALGTVAVTTLANITNRAVDAGLNLANALTIAPISAGLSEYETGLNSVQTILANTASAGTTIKDVNRTLNELNHYSDKTIYNFSEMARNIGTFTAAGVGLDKAAESIKGIANLAALSGSNSQQASTAMYQLSQAIAAGRVTLQDWNSVVNAGMGGSVFQRALARTAVAMGTIDESAVKLQGEMKNVVINGQSFRESISAKPGELSWLTSDVLTNTLSQFTGDLHRADLAAQGFNKAQIDAIIQQAKLAKDAATKVKTLTQLIDVAKETAQSGWAQTWRYIFGDFEEARETFTNASNTINSLINTMSDARNKILKDWKDLGGRVLLLDSISNVFNAIKRVVVSVGKAFRDVFPPLTGEKLFNFTKILEAFTSKLVISGHTMQDIRAIFRAFFNVLKIGVDIVLGVIKYVGTFIGLLSGGSGGVLDFAASIAHVINQLTKWINKGEYIQKFFAALIEAREKVLGPIISALSEVLSYFAGLAKSGVDLVFDNIRGALEKAAPYLALVQEFLAGVSQFISGKILDGLSAIKDFFSTVPRPDLQRLLGRMRDYAEQLSPYLEEAKNYLVQIGNVVRTKVLSAFAKVQAFVADIRDNISGFFSNIGNVSFSIDTSSVSSFFGGLIDGAKNLLPSIEEVKTSFSNFGDALVVVGKVIGAALIAPFALLGGLLSSTGDAASDAGSSIGSYLVTIKDFIVSAGKAAADLISKIDLQKVLEIINAVLVTGLGLTLIRVQNNLGKFLGSMAGFGTELKEVLGKKGVLGQLQKNLVSMQNNVRADSLFKIAAAVGLLAASLFLLAQLSPSQLAKGGAAISGLLVAIGLFSKKILSGGSLNVKEAAAKSTAITGLATAMAIMAVAINLLTVAVLAYGKMDQDVLKNGLFAVGSIVAAFAVLGTLLAKSGAGVGVAAALLALSVSMVILSAALLAFFQVLKLYSKLDYGALLKDISKLATVIVALGAALVVAGAGALGAPALLILAAALPLLIPSLVLLSAIGWSKILKGAGILAAALAIIGAASLIAAPGLILLGTALTLVGLGFLTFGIGVSAFAAGITLLGTVGAAAAVVLTSYISAIAAQLPAIVDLFGQAIIGMAKAIIKAAPYIEKAIGALLIALLRAIRKATPDLRKTFSALIRAGINVIRSFFGDLVDAGLTLIEKLLDGIEKHAPKIARKATNVMLAFMDAISKQYPRIIDKGFTMVVKLIDGVTRSINKHADDLGRAGGDLAFALVKGMAVGITTFARTLLDDAIDELVSHIPGPVRRLLGIASPSKVMAEIGGHVTEGLAVGISSNTALVGNASENLGNAAVISMQKSIAGISSLLDSNLDFNPRIVPVLDLSNLSREASKIGGLLNGQQVFGQTSYSLASQLSQFEQDKISAGVVRGGDIKFEFNQTNTSPKALSAVEIYRDSKSLFALAKEALISEI